MKGEGFRGMSVEGLVLGVLRVRFALSHVGAVSPRLMFRVQGLVFRVLGSGSRVWGSGCVVTGQGFRRIRGEGLVSEIEVANGRQS